MGSSPICSDKLSVASLLQTFKIGLPQDNVQKMGEG